jgi:hypothetical protein
MTLTQLDAMGLTLVVEVAVAAALGPVFARAALLCAAAAILGSCITHPILWSIFYDAQAAIGPFATPILEGAIIVAETFAYRALATPRWEEAGLFSVLANAASWGVGEIVHAL